MSAKVPLPVHALGQGLPGGDPRPGDLLQRVPPPRRGGRAGLVPGPLTASSSTSIAAVSQSRQTSPHPLDENM
jgi:hypothetical protein